MPMPILVRAGRPWGDGLVEDGWMDVQRVTRWEDCHPDEAIRLFPHLLLRDGRIPAPACDHLAAMVAARAWRLRATGARAQGPNEGSPGAPRGAGDRWTLMSMTVAEAEAIGAKVHADHFAPPGLLDRLMAKAFATPAAAADRNGDIAALLLLDDVLASARGERLRPYEPATAMSFAFLSGLHPAYLWPAAVCDADRASAAGWLGIVARGRPALMPIDVADFLLDVIICRDGVPVSLRDEAIGSLVRRTVDLRALWAAARARRRGVERVVRPQRAAASRTGVARGFGRGAVGPIGGTAASLGREA